jgi:hypothetical protein
MYAESRIVFECLAQFGNRSGKHFVADEGIRPYSAEDLLFRNDFTGALGEREQHLHNFGLEAGGAPGPLQAVHLGSDSPVPNGEPAQSSPPATETHEGPDYSLQGNGGAVAVLVFSRMRHHFGTPRPPHFAKLPPKHSLR